MNKQDWLDEAIKELDGMNTEEFEDFLWSCVPETHVVDVNFCDIKIVNMTLLPTLKSASKAVCTDDRISIAA